METVNTPEREKQLTDTLGFVFIGPSGAGKSTLRKEICRRKIDGHSFVSFLPVTTRQPRAGENEYLYVSNAKFDTLLDSDDLLFSNLSYGNRFLTLWPHVLRPLQHYIYIYLPEAAQKLKETFPNTRIVQIVPPDIAVIEDRIKARDMNIDPSELQQRLLSVEAEVAEGKQIADVVFINELPIGQSAELLSAQIGKLLTQ